MHTSLRSTRSMNCNHETSLATSGTNQPCNATVYIQPLPSLRRRWLGRFRACRTRGSAITFTAIVKVGRIGWGARCFSRMHTFDVSVQSTPRTCLYDSKKPRFTIVHEIRHELAFKADCGFDFKLTIRVNIRFLDTVYIRDLDRTG